MSPLVGLGYIVLYENRHVHSRNLGANDYLGKFSLLAVTHKAPSQKEGGGPGGNEIGAASYFGMLCADAEEGYYI